MREYRFLHMFNRKSGSGQHKQETSLAQSIKRCYTLVPYFDTMQFQHSFAFTIHTYININ